MQKTVYFMPGDGIGPELWAVTKPLLELALQKAYGNEHSLRWEELLAGEKALKETGELLPEATLTALRDAELAIKGPLNTPVGKGFRSLNVTLRQTLDLYACIRPVRYIPGVPSPMKHPEKIDMVIFRENTEDVYAGIEYQAGTTEAKKLIEFLRSTFGAKVDPEAAVGIKPMTARGSKRLVRRAIDFALGTKRSSVTLMHKGNIMKFTEGGFRQWGYEVAQEEYQDRCISEEKALTANEAAQEKLIIKDRIADALFQNVLLWPEEYSVIASPNLNGDYISDALAAQAGGLGMAPGMNMSDSLAFFEATHGTAPTIAGQDRANPGSMLLSGALMFDHLGWNKAADRIRKALDAVVAAKAVTEDLARQMDGATCVGTKKFGELLAKAM